MIEIKALLMILVLLHCEIIFVAENKKVKRIALIFQLIFLIIQIMI